MFTHRIFNKIAEKAIPNNGIVTRRVKEDKLDVSLGVNETCDNESTFEHPLIRVSVDMAVIESKDTTMVLHSRSSYLSVFPKLTACACYDSLLLEQPLRMDIIDNLKSTIDSLSQDSPISEVRIISVGSGQLLQEALTMISLSNSAAVIYLDLIDTNYGLTSLHSGEVVKQFVQLIHENTNFKIEAGVSGFILNSYQRELINVIESKPESKLCLEGNLNSSQETSSKKLRLVINFVHSINEYYRIMKNLPINQLSIPMVGMDIDAFPYSEKAPMNIEYLKSLMNGPGWWISLQTSAAYQTEVHPNVYWKLEERKEDIWRNVFLKEFAAVNTTKKTPVVP